MSWEDTPKTPDFILGGLVALRNKADDETFLVQLYQTIIAICLHRLAKGGPLVFTLDEYLAAMEEANWPEGLAVQRNDHEFTISHHHTPTPAEQQRRFMEMFGMVEPTEEAQA